MLNSWPHRYDLLQGKMLVEVESTPRPKAGRRLSSEKEGRPQTGWGVECTTQGVVSCRAVSCQFLHGSGQDLSRT